MVWKTTRSRGVSHRGLLSFLSVWVLASALLCGDLGLEGFEAALERAPGDLGSGDVEAKGEVLEAYGQLLDPVGQAHGYSHRHHFHGLLLLIVLGHRHSPYVVYYVTYARCRQAPRLRETLMVDGLGSTISVLGRGE